MDDDKAISLDVYEKRFRLLFSRWGLCLQWMAKTSFSNIVWLRCLAFTIGWPPVIYRNGFFEYPFDKERR